MRAKDILELNEHWQLGAPSMKCAFILLAQSNHSKPCRWFSCCLLTLQFITVGEITTVKKEQHEYFMVGGHHTWGSVLKGRMLRKIEKHCSKLFLFQVSPRVPQMFYPGLLRTIFSSEFWEAVCLFAATCRFTCAQNQVEKKYHIKVCVMTGYSRWGLSLQRHFQMVSPNSWISLLWRNWHPNRKGERRTGGEEG